MTFLSENVLLCTLGKMFCPFVLHLYTITFFICKNRIKEEVFLLVDVGNNWSVGMSDEKTVSEWCGIRSWIKVGEN